MSSQDAARSFHTPRAHGSLSSWDDYPVHQIAETVRHAATSDRNFYDRYYFNCHSNDGDALVIFGFGQYPNLAVADAFMVLVTGTTHRVVRCLAGARRPDGHLGRAALGGGDPAAGGTAGRRRAERAR